MLALTFVIAAIGALLLHLAYWEIDVHSVSSWVKGSLGFVGMFIALSLVGIPLLYAPYKLWRGGQSELEEMRRRLSEAMNTAHRSQVGGLNVGGDVIISGAGSGIYVARGSQDTNVGYLLHEQVLQNIVVDIRAVADPKGLISNKRFLNCTIVGPGVLCPAGHLELLNNRFLVDGQWLWSVPTGAMRVTGVFGLQDCVFEDCEFQRIAFAGPPDFTARLTALMDDGLSWVGLLTP